MRRFILAAMLGAMVLATPAHATQALWTDGEVSIGEAGKQLFGSFIRPPFHQSDEAFDAVLIIPGSGPTDRNGNGSIINTDAYRLVAMALGEVRIGSLRIDKRGVGASAGAVGREEDLRFDTYIEDTKAWIQFLREQKGVRRVIVLGHSEGVLIGSIAVQAGGADKFIAVAGAGEPLAATLRRQLSEGLAAGPLLDNALETLALLERGEPAPNVNILLYGLFRPSVQPYMISWLRFDPVAEISKVTVPTFIIQGTNDFQVLPRDAELLHAGNPSSELVIINGMNHVLKASEADRAAQKATYSDPALPLHPDLMPALIDFINQ